jgi:hypothetical protein
VVDATSNTPASRDTDADVYRAEISTLSPSTQRVYQQFTDLRRQARDFRRGLQATVSHQKESTVGAGAGDAAAAVALQRSPLRSSPAVGRRGDDGASVDSGASPSSETDEELRRKYAVAASSLQVRCAPCLRRRVGRTACCEASHCTPHRVGCCCMLYSSSLDGLSVWQAAQGALERERALRAKFEATDAHLRQQIREQLEEIGALRDACDRYREQRDGLITPIDDAVAVRSSHVTDMGGAVAAGESVSPSLTVGVGVGVGVGVDAQRPRRQDIGVGAASVAVADVGVGDGVLSDARDGTAAAGTHDAVASSEQCVIDLDAAIERVRVFRATAGAAHRESLDVCIGGCHCLLLRGATLVSPSVMVL